MRNFARTKSDDGPLSNESESSAQIENAVSHVTVILLCPSLFVFDLRNFEYDCSCVEIGKISVFKQ